MRSFGLVLILLALGGCTSVSPLSPVVEAPLQASAQSRVHAGPAGAGEAEVRMMREATPAGIVSGTIVDSTETEAFE